MIPVSVIVMTRNEEARLPRCLSALTRFDQVLVVDSNSNDATVMVARSFGIEPVPFTWTGTYPKKKQWCLQHPALRHDRVLYIDADEIMTPELADEIAGLDWACSAYFVPGRMIWDGRVLHYGLRNNKLALLDRREWAYPVVNDLDLPGMGEIEGHYQPVPGVAGAKAGQLKSALVHDAAEHADVWRARHERYAAWEAGMNARRAWPRDPLAGRQSLKRIARAMPLRPVAVFLYAYVLKRGFMDGRAGLDYALARAWYARRIAALSAKTQEAPA